MPAIPKPARWRSKKYIEWIKTQPCFLCQAPAEPHHIKGIGDMSGGGLKAPDWAVMPLCHPCHDRMQRNPGMWPDQWEMIVVTLGRAIEDGVLK